MKRFLYDYPFAFVFFSVFAYVLFKHGSLWFVVFLILSFTSVFRLRVFAVSLVVLYASVVFSDSCKTYTNTKDLISGKIYKVKKSKRNMVYIKTKNGKMIVFTSKTYDNLDVGEIIDFQARIKPVSSLRNSHFKQYLIQNNICYIGFLKHIKTVIPRSGFFGFWQNMRDKIKEEFGYFLNGNESRFLESAVLGYPMAYSKIKNELINTQLAHISVVSGLHMGFVFGLFYFLFYFLFAHIRYFYSRYDLRITASLFAVLPVFVYFLISGMHLPAVRSFLMLLAFVFAVMFGYEKNSYNILFFVAALFAAFAGYDVVLNASFVLSFFMSFSAIFIYSSLSKMRLSGVYLYVVFSIVMSIFAVPIVAFYFHKFSYTSFLNNLVAMPYFAALIMPVSFFTVGASFVSIFYIKYTVFNVLTFVTGIFLKFVAFTSNIGACSVKISIYGVLVCYLFMFLGLFLIQRKTSTSSK